ncbi:hypothetical protein WDW86_03030 [Bdellovibrionota bacterium FG-2]
MERTTQGVGRAAVEVTPLFPGPSQTQGSASRPKTLRWRAEVERARNESVLGNYLSQNGDVSASGLEGNEKRLLSFAQKEHFHVFLERIRKRLFRVWVSVRAIYCRCRKRSLIVSCQGRGPNMRPCGV